MTRFGCAHAALLALVAGCTCLLPVVPCAADDGAASIVEAPLRFRRVYAPEDRLEKWPRKAIRYIPMEPGEFESLLKRAKLAGTAPHALASIASAEYTGQLVDARTLAGTAKLNVAHRADRAVLMPLGPCNLAINEPQWTDDPSRPALLGLAEGGATALRVSQGGVLQLSWSLRGSQADDGTTRFVFELPKSPGSELRLSLPKPVELTAEQGTILVEEAKESENRVWRVLGSGNRPLVLCMGRAETLSGESPHSAVRQSSVYDVSLRGVDLSAQLKLAAADHWPEQLVLLLDRPLKLVTAHLGEQLVPWRTEPASDDQSIRIVLELPEKEARKAKVLRIGALAPLVTGRSWQLPRIRPQDVFWQQGETTLLVPRPLALQELRPIGCRQLKAGPLAVPLAGESFVFQSFHPNASVEMVLVRSANETHVTEGIAIELRESEIAATMVAEVTVSEGEWFDLDGNVGRHWVVDSVESTPSTHLDDWSIESVEGNRRLKVRLRKAVSPMRPLRLRVRARRLLSPVGRPLTVRELLPMEFLGVRDRQRFVAIRAAEPYRLESSGAHQFGRVAPDAIPESLGQSLSVHSADLVFKYERSIEGLSVALRPQKPKYSAQTEVTAEVRPESLREIYRIRCVPLAGRVSRVQVHFSQRRSQAPQWSFGESGDLLPAVERLGPPSDAASAMLAHGETWQIELPAPQSEPFELRAERVASRDPATAVSLACLPDSDSEQATLHVESFGSARFRIENVHLDPIPAAPAIVKSPGALRASYRYDPLHETLPGTGPGILIHAICEADAAAGAWVWSSRLQSRYAIDGFGRHVLSCRVENASRRELRFALPEAVPLEQILGVWHEGGRARWQRVDGDDSKQLTVELPRDSRFVSLGIHYTTRGKPLGLLTTLRPPVMRPDVPVLSGQWVIWVPPAWNGVGSPGGSAGAPVESQAWARRLLGPLGRPSNEMPFDPFSTADWERLVGSFRSDDETTTVAGAALASLAKVAQKQAAEAEARPTWGRLLAEGATLGGLPLKIDHAALAAAGVEPSTPLSRPPRGTPADQGEAILDRAGLALLMLPESAVLTSGLEVALLGRVAEPLPWKSVFRAAGELGADTMAERLVPGETERLVSPQTWIAVPGPRVPAWREIPEVAELASDTPGWHAYRVASLEADKTSLTIARTSSFESLRWAILFVALALGWWLLGERPGQLALAAGAAALLCLWLPPIMVPAASGALLGLLACLGFWLIRVGRPPDDAATSQSWPSRPSVQRAVAAPLGTLLLALAAFAALGSLAWGDSPDGATNDTSPATYDVFVPVDGERKPTGGKYYVPEPLHNALHLRAARPDGVVGRWLVRAAEYRASINGLSGTDGATAVEVLATYEIEVLARGAQVELPLGRSGANLLREGARLDGNPIEVDWDETGRMLRFTVAEPGRYRLELDLRPATGQSAGFLSIDMAIPRVPNTQLEVRYPPQIATPEIRSGQGRVTVETEPPRLAADLGPTDRLRLRWPVDESSASTGPAIEVEQLLWLKIRPGSVVLDTKMICQASRKPVNRLLLNLDPQLRLLRLPEDQSGVEAKAPSSSDSTAIAFELAEPLAERRTIEASFLLQEATGVGNIRLPRIEVADARISRRWLGVSVDPELTFEPQGNERVEPVAVPDFATAWKAAEQQPLAAFDITPAQATWAISARPTPPQTKVDQHLALGIGLHEIWCELHASLDTSGGYVFQHRLSAPRGFQVDEVSVMHDNAERVARVASVDGKLTVFLTGPISGAQELRISGHVPIDGPGQIELPAICVAEADDAVVDVTLYRRSEVLLDLAALDEIPAEDAAEAVAENRRWGRLVRRLRVSAERLADPIRLGVAPNRPDVEATQVTRLRAGEEGWEAEVLVNLRCDDGLLDELYLEVPENWTGPYEVDSSIPVELTGPEGASGQVVLRPAGPIDGTWRVSLRGPLGLAAGEPVRPPRVRLPAVEIVSHLVVLPKRPRSKPVQWKTRNLLSTTVPSEFPMDLSAAGPVAAFQVTRNDFDAQMTSDKSQPGRREVYLADIRVGWDLDATCWGVASFSLNPAGSPDCVLAMPSGTRLVQVFAGGLPVQPEGLRERRYLVRLGPPHLPQRVDVVYTVASGAPKGVAPIAVESPRLVDLPVRKTLWSVAQPSGRDWGVAAKARFVGQAETELVRLDAIVQMLGAASGATFEEADDAKHWCETTARHYAAARHRFREQLALTPDLAGNVSAIERLSALDQRARALAASLDAEAVFRGALSAERVLEQVSELWRASVGGDRRITSYETAPAADKLVLVAPATVRPGWLSRVGASALLAGLVLALWWVGRRGQLADGLSRLPALFGVAGGILWWLFLWPSVLGLGLIALFVFASVRSGWKSRRPGGATIVPLGQP